VGNDTALCALRVRYKFGPTEGEKEWLSGFYATPNEALGFFDFVVGIQEVNKSLANVLILPNVFVSRPNDYSPGRRSDLN
jgi:hypothetical protein